MNCESVQSLAEEVWSASFEQAALINAQLIAEFQAAISQPDSRKSHFFNGRYENLYIQEQHLPSLKPLRKWLMLQAGKITGQAEDQLKYGFWFNRMAAGHSTTRHDHLDDDEQLSAVYYLKVPQDSGNLLLYTDKTPLSITPETGLCVLFKPHIEHEVGINNSTEERLSIAFNFGYKT
ncbi:MAG: 2OG-Fe(II) oxygenase family protein [gamma proteobacterium symbiont of Bathyaustriella thionipta]|nr:2OG-Fe(II) oxygenase family protein [gamma proteobacterium symbiont of Bathyaustriella thionipta]